MQKQYAGEEPNETLGEMEQKLPRIQNNNFLA